MRIAVITSGILPVPALLGGAVENLVDYYLEYNNQYKIHDITVYSISSSRTREIKDTVNVHYRYVDITSLWARIKRKLFVLTHTSKYYNSYIEYFLYEVVKFLKYETYDYIILENTPGFTIPISKVSNAKIIIHLHNDFLNHTSKLAKEICDVAHKVITVSNFIKSRVETIGSKVPIVTVHNGIEVDKFYKAESIDRATLGFSDSDFIVLYSGRIIPEKGVKELINAFSMLKEYPSIKLLIMGGNFFGNDNPNDSYINSLKKISKDLQNKIVFTGFVPYHRVSSYLKMADLAVVPSMWEEPFGLTCLEAISSGLPTIATDVGGIKEICVDCAVIISKENIVHQLHKEILTLYNNPLIRKGMSMRGVEISKRFTKEKYAHSIFGLLEE
jgi:glycosyltransferase involved in cell wall biosynthesis